MHECNKSDAVVSGIPPSLYCYPLASLKAENVNL